MSSSPTLPSRTLPGAVKTGHVALHLTELSDFVDLSASEWIPHPTIEGMADIIFKLVLAPPPGGLPPLFRLRLSPGHLFVSAEAKEVLEGAGLGGILYSPASAFVG